MPTYRAAPSLMSRFQANNIGRPVTGWSGIIPMRPTVGQTQLTPLGVPQKIKKR